MLFLGFYIHLTEWPEGNYVLDIVVKDNLSGRTVSGGLSLRLESAGAQNYRTSASPAATPSVYETTGTLRSFEKKQDGWQITLLVNRRQASALVADNCRYYLNAIEVTQEAFIEWAMGEQVTVEFYGERSDGVSLCRAHVKLSD